MSLPAQRATDLRKAYRICEVKPLEGEDLDHYYTDFGEASKSEIMNDINQILSLQEAGEFTTILFTGHRGCGKSTELRRLERKWQEEYHVIYLETDKITDINDVAYTDLYLLLIQSVEQELRKLNIKQDPDILKNVEEWFSEVTKEKEETVERSISLVGEVTLGVQNPVPIPFLAKLLARLTSQIRGGAKSKVIIRRNLEREFSQLKANINLLLDDGFQKLQQKRPDCKRILVIFDNLDRCPPKVADGLFLEYGTQLQDVHCTVIYTVPISAVYSSRDLTGSFRKPYIVPMVNIYEYEDTTEELNYNQRGKELLLELLEKRMDISQVFVGENVALDLIHASGGNLRHLMDMLQQACLRALGRKHTKMEAEDAISAIKELQFNFERIIPDSHYPVIAKTFQNKQAPSDEIGQETLFNSSVLEYNGNRRWNYPHPTVIKTNAFKHALAKLQSES